MNRREREKIAGELIKVAKDLISYSSNLKKGDKLQHSRQDNISIELVAPTKRGWKVKQTEIFGRGKPRTKTTFYDTQDLEGSRAYFRKMTAAWPSKVKEGGLRSAMGLSTDKPLEEQTSPSAVIKFFEGADKKGRGMVMFAVNSNKDSAFWKKVKAGI